MPSSPVYCETPTWRVVPGEPASTPHVPGTSHAHVGNTRTWPVPSAPWIQCALTTANRVTRPLRTTGGCGSAVETVRAHDNSGYSGYCLASFSTRARRSFSYDASIFSCNQVTMLPALSRLALAP